jgi:hypothetical protein
MVVKMVRLKLHFSHAVWTGLCLWTVAYDSRSIQAGVASKVNSASSLLQI